MKLRYLVALILLTNCSGDDEEQKPPPDQVSANFTVSHTTIKVGESVTYTDLSDRNVNEWKWSFEGGVPNSSTEQNPVVRYDSPGSFNVSLTVFNGNLEDTEVKENYITITIEVVETPTGSFEAGDETTFGLSATLDRMQSMITLDDGSFVCVGWTDNNKPQKSILNILVAKFDSNLELIWDKLIEGSAQDVVREIIPTNDGGFLLSATTRSKDGDIPENKGESDITIIKLTENGDIEWVKTYGGSGYDGVNTRSLIKREEGYAFIGHTSSEDAGIPGKVGNRDIWLVEIDDNGNTGSSFALGSADDDYAYALVKSGAGYVVLSEIGAIADDFDKPGLWLFEVNSDGQIGWKTFINGQYPGEVIKTQDGGYLSLNAKASGTPDLLVTKFDNQGRVQWEKLYPLPEEEFAQSVIEIEDGYIILGRSESTSATRPVSPYVAKINQVGEIVQSETFGNGNAVATRILKAGDQKFILGGGQAVGPNAEFWLQIVTDTK